MSWNAFRWLRLLGLLQNNRAVLKPIIYELMDPENSQLLQSDLRLMLGPKLDGPRWLVCNCPKCLERRGLMSKSEDALFDSTFADVEAVVRQATARRRYAR